jgi:NDP-sugar pyrophosphorylase family protein
MFRYVDQRDISSSERRYSTTSRKGTERVVQLFRRLIGCGELMACRDEGYWSPMDTLRGRQVLEEMMERGDTTTSPQW